MDKFMPAARAFLAGYWAFAEWLLICLGVIVVLLVFPLRRPGKAFAVLLVGVYVTIAWYFLRESPRLNIRIPVALGCVICTGLVVLTVLYCLLFIRSDN